MDELKERDQKAYELQFKDWIEQIKVKKVKSLEDLYASVHDAIRKDPAFKAKKPLDKPNHTREGDFIVTSKAKYPRHKKLTNEQRKERVKEKIRAALEQ